MRCKLGTWLARTVVDFNEDASRAKGVSDLLGEVEDRLSLGIVNLAFEDGNNNNLKKRNNENGGKSNEKREKEDGGVNQNKHLKGHT